MFTAQGILPVRLKYINTWSAQPNYKPLLVTNFTLGEKTLTHSMFKERLAGYFIASFNLNKRPHHIRVYHDLFVFVFQSNTFDIDRQQIVNEDVISKT